MAALTVRSVTYAGTATLQAASTSDTANVGNGHDTFLLYENTNASPRTVTITLPVTGTPYTEVAAPTVQYTLAGTTGRLWIPLHPDYADSTGSATITLDNATGVTVAVVRTDWNV